MFWVFFASTLPTSSMANPVCMRNTKSMPMLYGENRRYYYSIILCVKFVKLVSLIRLTATIACPARYEGLCSMHPATQGSLPPDFEHEDSGRTCRRQQFTEFVNKNIISKRGQWCML
jgi:hypothetical protein